jgi:peptidyl-prolyl cis-trans isomerase B (cyclophilin B)
MQAVAQTVVMFSVLIPGKLWYSPNQPIDIHVKDAGGEVTLVLLDFLGKVIDARAPITINGDQTIDLKQPWPQLEQNPGTYLVLAVPKGKAPKDFVGTPLVIQVRADTKRRDAPPGPMVIKVDALRYVVMCTDKGDVSMIFYYDVAPTTVGSFLRLAEGGYFDGLTFHRVVPGFVVQSGDPRGDSTGGPGYRLEAEFNSHEHREGVLSMARQSDPIERQGAMPRPEYANSAGSQFFICLDYNRTKQLNGLYTAFGEVESGMDVVQAIGKVPTDPKAQKPLEPVYIKTMKVISVTSQNNPYADVLNLSPIATTAPAEQ